MFFETFFEKKNRDIRLNKKINGTKNITCLISSYNGTLFNIRIIEIIIGDKSIVPK